MRKEIYENEEPLYYSERGYYPPRALPIDSPIPELWKNITLLTDVNSIYIYINDKKKYFFFGDEHFSKSAGGCEEKLKIKCDDYNGNFSDSRYYGTTCTSIGILLHNWFLYNNDHRIKTDFYLELAFTNDNERAELQKHIALINEAKQNNNPNEKYDFENVSWLELIASVMNKCFIREKQRCPYYPNVRAHYTDIRSLDTDNISIIADPFLLYDLGPYLNKAFNNIRTNQELEELRDELSIILSIVIFDYRKILTGILTPTDFDNFIKYYINLASSFSGQLEEFYFSKFVNMKKITVIRKGVRMHKAAAELARLRDENAFLATLIEEFIYEKADDYIKNIKHLYDEIMNIFNEVNVSFYELGLLIGEAFQELILALVPMSALSMDSYLLARMFLQNDSNEIIVYAGSAHIEHYADFFENYIGIKRTAGVESELGNRCLELITLPKYLDANKYRTYAVNKKYKAYLDWLQER